MIIYFYVYNLDHRQSNSYEYNNWKIILKFKVKLEHYLLFKITFFALPAFRHNFFVSFLDYNKLIIFEPNIVPTSVDNNNIKTI